MWPSFRPVFVRSTRRRAERGEHDRWRRWRRRAERGEHCGWRRWRRLGLAGRRDPVSRVVPRAPAPGGAPFAPARFARLIARARQRTHLSRPFLGYFFAPVRNGSQDAVSFPARHYSTGFEIINPYPGIIANNLSNRTLMTKPRYGAGSSTPGFMMPAGSSAALAPLSAAAKMSERWRSYQGMWSRPTAWWWVMVPPASMIASETAFLTVSYCAESRPCSPSPIKVK